MANDGDLPTSIPDLPDPPDTPAPDPTDPRPTLPSVLPRSPAARGVVAAVLTFTLVGAFVVGQQFSTPDARSPGPGGSFEPAPSASASGSLTPAFSTPRPAPTHADVLPVAGWAGAELPPLRPVAELVPTKAYRQGISQRATFTLRTLTATPAATLAAGLTADPPIAFTTKAGPGTTAVTVKPTQALEPGRDYRFTLRSGGLLAGSWIFRTSQPPTIVGTLPRGGATGVPVDTGLELTFDQDGVGSIAPYFRISPEVAGTFERHGRSWVFVPQYPLGYATVYTVTVRHGVPLEGSDQALSLDSTFAFETVPKPVVGPTSTPTPAPWFPTPARDVVEVDPGEPPLLAFNAIPADTRAPRLDVAVHRFATFEDAVDAFITSRGAPGWARWSTEGLVPTDDVPLMLSFPATLETAEGMYGSWIRFPERVEPGWYLVVFEREGRDRQVFLQVTDLAVYVAVTSTETLAWVNDVTTGRPVEGASVRFLGRSILGRTDGDGVASGPTPATVRKAWAGSEEWEHSTPATRAQEVARGTTMIVRAPDAGPAPGTRPGRATFVPVTLATGRPYMDNYTGSDTAGEDDRLHILSIDRRIYRRTDRVDAWGMVRERTGGQAPRSVQLRLGHSSDDAVDPLVTVTAKVDPATGTFRASIPFVDLPYDWYGVDMLVGGVSVDSAWISVEEIVKPTYRLATSVNRHVAIDGDPITVAVQGTFFDDTPAAGMPVRVNGDPERELTTDAGGTATFRTTARWPGSARDGYDTTGFHSYPVEGYESAATASDSVVVFPSSVWLEASGVFAGDRLNVTASTTRVDAAAIEKLHEEDPWSWSPRDGPPAAARISVQVTQISTKKVRTGAIYDPILKLVIGQYQWIATERDLGTQRTSTGAAGSVTVPVPVAVNYLGHRVHIVATDGAGRITETTFVVRRPRPGREVPPAQVLLENGLVWPHLGDSGCGERWYGSYGDDGYYGRWYGSRDGAYEPPDGSYGTGDAVEIPFRDREGGLMPTGGSNRYLFFLAQQGLGDVRVQASPVFADAFRAEWAPNVSLAAVRFTGTTYEPAISPYVLRFDATERQLTISVATDAERYRPGGRATVSVITTDASGQPVPATVFLRVIDEKLYAMDGAVGSTEPLSALYVPVGAGILQTYATQPHPVPPARGCYYGEGGATGGGGGDSPPWREDFRDVLLFARVRTGADGQGSASFNISDDLTSWRVTAAAVTADLRAGTGQHDFAVGLPFFIEAPVATTFVAGDRPTLRVRAFGTALSAKSRITFAVSVPALGMAPRRLTATGYGSAEVPLPVLPVGEHKVRITASTTSGGRTLRDALVRTVRVVGTRFTDRRTVVADVRDGVPAASGDGMTSYYFTDAGRGRYLDTLYGLLYESGARVDAALAADVAWGILVDRLGMKAEDLPGQTFVPYAYQNLGGITLLPYSSPDLALSARVALVAPDAFDRGGLQSYFSTIGEDPNETRERRAIALAGLAATGGDVLDRVRAMLADPTLTIREQLYLALAAAVLGDHATALAVERALLEQHGERLGQQLRLRVGASLDDTLEATALAAMVGAVVGDPVASLAEAYVEANPGHDDLYSLQQVAFIDHALDRLPVEAGSFSYTVGGKRRVVDLGQGGSFWLELTPAQRAGFSAKVRSGRVSVAVTFEAPVDIASIARDPSVRIERVVIPSSPIPSRAPVEVMLRVSFDALALDRCYWVTDVAPSGLVPTDRWLALGMGAYDSEAEGPWWVDGNRVGFGACPSEGDRATDDTGRQTVEMAYWARVIMPGTFRWEPALIHASGVTDRGAVIPETTVVIR